MGILSVVDPEKNRQRNLKLQRNKLWDEENRKSQLGNIKNESYLNVKC
jgi:hypothetical protein